MLSFLPQFWDFFFAPLFAFTIESPIYAPLALCIIVLAVYVFIRRVMQWCFSF